MAPQPPSKMPSARTLRHQRITGQIHPLLPPKIFRPGAAVTDSFLESKRDRRLMKHSSFLSRVRASSDKISKDKIRRRRPGKKLTSMAGLADSLPKIVDGDAPPKGKIRQESLKSKKGYMKKKEALVKMETRRLTMNIGQLSKIPDDSSKMLASSMDDKAEEVPAKSGGPAQTDRYAALRAHISSRLEQDPRFAK